VFEIIDYSRLCLLSTLGKSVRQLAKQHDRIVQYLAVPDTVTAMSPLERKSLIASLRNSSILAVFLVFAFMLVL